MEQEEGPMNAKEIQVALKKNYSVVRNLIKKLVDNGSLIRANGKYAIHTFAGEQIPRDVHNAV